MTMGTLLGARIHKPVATLRRETKYAARAFLNRLLRKLVRKEVAVAFEFDGGWDAKLRSGTSHASKIFGAIRPWIN
ncbi:hypothetical protein K443DRAFT_15084 [Laccaria amethystina LaAM-08-1]|uniref:Uncharacterized protein n=1 Tax=Laccaria amethystina LaAM-08-1 TaxID=1095629 RepID=A0A0C9WH54_9AGAR|nr:hypothetical protein K443DRAFT_15084 [Laccaria amethystina LaAM-08-1]